MTVCPQITEDLVGPAEGWFAVDHPAVAEELAEKTVEDFGLRQGLELFYGQLQSLAEKTVEDFGLRQGLELSVELKLSRREGLLHGFDELATEDFAENCFRDEEVAAPGTNPACVIRR